MKYLHDQMIGLQVKSIFVADGTVGMGFLDGASLAVYNPYSLSCDSATDLIGKTVEDLKEKDGILTVLFSDSIRLTIGLKEADYGDGCEAFVFTSVDGPILVQRWGDD